MWKNYRNSGSALFLRFLLVDRRHLDAVAVEVAGHVDFVAEVRLGLVLLVELVDLLVGVVVEDQRLSFFGAFQRAALVLRLVAFRGAGRVSDPAGPGGGL